MNRFRRMAPRLSMVAVVLAVGLPGSGSAQSTALLERREVRADGHPLSVWSKRPPTKARGAILLLHGRTWSARPNFDLQVPGRHVSLMDALVAEGYAVYALDQRGYGGTPRDSSGWLTPGRAERDVDVVLDWIAKRESGASATRRPALLGYSRGSQVAVLVAQRHPEKIASLILFGYPQPPGGVRPTAEPASPPRARTTAAAAGEDFITPAATPPGVKDAYVRMATSMDSVRVDWRLESEFSEIDPAKIHVPTLMLDGERDPYANAAGHPTFFAQLGTADRWWVVLPGVDHAAHLETQDAFVNALIGFLERRGSASAAGR